jgi:hypothetical protein
MEDLTRHYTHFLKIYFKDCNASDESFTVKIRKKESERFKKNIESYNNNKEISKFFIGDTIDGKYVGINISLIQAVHILWEPSALPEEEIFYDGPIKIYLRNREKPIETYTEDPDILFVFYHDLEQGSENAGSFISFMDEDGEEIFINMEELLFIECPKSMAIEGYEMIKKR